MEHNTTIVFLMRPPCFRGILYIMIQNVSQIEKEFLIKSVVQNAQPVRFHGMSTAGTGLITNFERSNMTVSLLETIENACFGVCERVTCYFDCHGKSYAFETVVRDNKQRNIIVDPPAQLLRSLQRKFVRVKKPRNVQVIFHLSNEEIKLDYPVCPEYVSVEEYDVKSKIQGKNLPEIVSQFKQSISDTCSENTIIMFRNRKPSCFEEELISKTGKVLFVPSTGASLPKKDPYPEGRIITEEQEEKFEDPNFFIEGSRFEKLLKEKKGKGISSEIWCPIIYYQYVVGYIYVTDRSGGSFDVSMVDYLWDFSRILAFNLKQTGYFSGEKKSEAAPGHQAQVLDMSPGGTLISLPRSEIRTPIKEGSVFSVDVLMGDKTVNCSVKVVRRYEESEAISYGMTFLNLSSQDVMQIYEGLYRKPYNERDSLAFEQS